MQGSHQVNDRHGGNRSQPTAAREDESVSSVFSDDDDMTTSVIMRVVNKVVIVFPKVEPLPWDTFFKISLICAIPAAVYILLFTRMGFGLSVFQFVAGHMEQYAYYLAAALTGFIFSLYMLDFSYWETKCGKIMRRISWGIFVLGCMVVILFLSGEYPYGPICLFAVLTPMWLVLMKHLFYDRKSTRVYVSWLSGPLFFVSLLTVLLWLIWTFLRDENEWNEVTRLEAAEETGCEPNFEEYPDCQNSEGDVCFEVVPTPPDVIFPEGCDEECVKVYDQCLNTFILWVGPLLVSLALFFLSFFCTFLRTEGTNEKDIINFGKLWIFLLFAMWVTASLAGMGSGVTAALLALTLASFAGTFVFLAASFSRPDQKEQAKAVWRRVKAKYGDHLDTARGLAIVVTLPLALIYVGLSFINQCVRRTRIFRCSRSPERSTADDDSDQGGDGRSHSDDAKMDWITDRTRQQVNTVKSWDRSKVYTYAIYWGAAFMVLSVIVAQLTVLFLSWLIEKTSTMSLGAVTGILVGVGLVMFLLPPVPGVPIYLTLGIVIVAIGKDTLGYIGSMAYAAAVSLALKLLACTLQQKLIGENLSHYVSVRQFVGINSNLIRSMRLVLADPGIGIAKVSILIGGPDWPTSVLCGLMNLDLIPILVGTLPVIFLILPTMLTGSFTYMASLNEHGTPLFPWAGVAATIFAALTAIVQFGSMIIAAFFLEQTASLRQDDINAIPIDAEVKEADDKAEYGKKVYTDVTQWAVVPKLAKFTITLSLVCMVSCCYMVQLFPSECFEDYELTDTISGQLDGNWTNLFKPLGRIAVLLFVISCALLWCFTSWAKRKSVLIVKGTTVSPEHGMADGGETLASEPTPAEAIETIIPSGATEGRRSVTVVSTPRGEKSKSTEEVPLVAI
eukprot:CAMPEP_0197436476 /NCGR_PEP_ID=MMETSP1175-20131217/3917_1 /TAXON_ID=1003142 /ORGANISM="Triceratium dubium, Strain CCMP147" /LENGTH=900 /DNA_ID=CAMNT_0042965775 /DNA_START=350 /DNA_END=3052 /DNA_ORIENTATION=+